MAILRHILTVLTATMLTGCYENFNPETDTKPVLCLNSLITAGEPIEIEVSHTWRFNDKPSRDNHKVTDAIVTVIVNGNVVDESYIPKENDHIEIIAKSKTYGTATADITVPCATPIGKVKVTPLITQVLTSNNDTHNADMFAELTFNLYIEMDVTDHPEVNNYYQFEYYGFSPSTDEEQDEFYTPVLRLGKFEYDAEPIFKEHVGALETIMGFADESNFVFFTDRQFSGTTYTLHLNFSDIVFRVKTQQFDESLLECGLELYLTSVSQSYYNWAVYKWNVDEGMIGDMADLGLAESKWGFSNVSTGAGVVAAQSSTRFTLNLKEFLKTALNEN